MVVGYRKIHITFVMNPAVKPQITSLHVIVHILIRPVLDSPLSAIIDAEKPGGTAKAAEAVAHVKIVVHRIYTVKT